MVTDESGAPLEGATVTLGTMEWHGIVGLNTLEKFQTDREGHPWQPSATGVYAITLRTTDPSIRTRRLDTGYYLCEVAIDQIGAIACAS
jgi:hypothetical protein